MGDTGKIQYLIDADDRIVFVSGDWDQFATDNDAADLKTARIVNRSLWQFVTEKSTREVYAEVLKSVRAGRTAEFTMRCDGPAVRRLVEISVKPLPEGEVEFTTRVLATKERPPQPLLSRSARRSDRKVNVCTWCDRVQVAADEWRDVEEAVEPLQLKSASAMPRVTPAVCPHCMEKMAYVLAEMERD